MRDRLVHAALKQVFEPILEPHFSNDSFGFRPGRSVPGALITATRLISSRRSTIPEFPYLVNLDVDSCFDTIDHQILTEKLGHLIADEEILKLVGSLLAVAGSTTGFPWSRRQAGIVQGSGLSPLLCNLYLTGLDRALKQLAMQCNGGIRALRYADDLLILAKTQTLASNAIETCRRTLRASRQAVKKSKLSVRNAIDGTNWLGVEIRPREGAIEGRVEFGYYIPSHKVESMLTRITEMTAPPNARIDPSAFDLGRWIWSINEQLTDWWNSYVYAENSTVVMRCIDTHTHERVGELLQAVTGLRRQAVEKEFRVRLPRGFKSWLVQGTRLKVLSALAPRNPGRCFFRPLWTNTSRFQTEQTDDTLKAEIAAL